MWTVLNVPATGRGPTPEFLPKGKGTASGQENRDGFAETGKYGDVQYQNQKGRGEIWVKP